MNIEEALQVIGATLAEVEGTDESQSFQPWDLKLQVMKAIIGYTAPRVNILALGQGVTRTETRIIQNAFDSVITQASEQYDDGFIKFLQCIKNVTIYFAENDITYRQWLKALLFALLDETNKALPALAMRGEKP